MEFWTVWPLIKKKRVKINTMLHAFIKQLVLMWSERKRLSTNHSTGFSWLYKSKQEEADMDQTVFETILSSVQKVFVTHVIV